MLVKFFSIMIRNALMCTCIPAVDLWVGHLVWVVYCTIDPHVLWNCGDEFCTLLYDL